MAEWLSYSTAYGILLDHGSDRHPLHRKVDSELLDHQGSTVVYLLDISILLTWEDF